MQWSAQHIVEVKACKSCLPTAPTFITIHFGFVALQFNSTSPTLGLHTISTARSCISGCGVESNPFALESMTTICSAESMAEVATISDCLTQQGDQIMEACSNECGDYEEINSHVYELTKSTDQTEMNLPSWLKL
uniref:Uncharacterized protein n=1 Tax=Ditylenchus dipsaci TaxID=166011 RepID=A0A915DIG5_9BILA